MLNGANLIGLIGKAGSGKDTVACHLNDTYQDTWVTHFADPLKAGCAAIFDIPEEDFSNRHRKKESDTFWGATPRQIAQFVATELFREHIHKLLPWVKHDFWIKALERKFTEHSNDVFYEAGDTVVVADVRFQNEVDWILEKGGLLIEIVRDTEENIGGIPNHVSEHDVDHRGKSHRIINNSTKGDLYNQVERLIDTHCPFQLFRK